MLALVRYDMLLPSFRMSGCPDSEIKTQLREAGYDFFRRSECWLYTIPSIDIVANQKAYTLSTGLSAQIRRIHAVRINDANNIAAGNKGVAQDLTRIDFVPPDALTLPDAPLSSVTDGLEVDVKLCPYRFSDEIPAVLLDLWSDGIIAGTLARLYDYPKNCPWSNSQKAQEQKDIFSAAINQATVDSDKGYRNVELVSSTPDFLLMPEGYYKR